MRTPTKSQDTTMPIGSIVRVTNSGHGYSTYADMARFMKLSKWEEQDYSQRNPKEDTVYTVIAKGVHEHSQYGEVLGLEDKEGNQVMIGISGVKLVQRSVLSVTSQVAALEAQLATVTAERDALKEQIESVRRLFVPVC